MTEIGNTPIRGNGQNQDANPEISNLPSETLGLIVKFLDIDSISELFKTNRFMRDVGNKLTLSEIKEINQFNHDNVLYRPNADFAQTEVILGARLDLAYSGYTPAGALAELANDKNDDVREAVAGHENTPAYVLGELAKDENNEVRKAVAGNESTPAHVLPELANDKNDDVRKAVAGNKNTPAYVLAELAKDENNDVRKAVAGNKNTPENELLELTSDYNNSVRKTALSQLRSRG